MLPWSPLTSPGEAPSPAVLSPRAWPGAGRRQARSRSRGDARGRPPLSARRVPGAVGALSRHRRVRPHGAHLPPGAVPARVLSYGGGGGGGKLKPQLPHRLLREWRVAVRVATEAEWLWKAGGARGRLPAANRARRPCVFLQRCPACAPSPGRSSGGPAVPRVTAMSACPVSVVPGTTSRCPPCLPAPAEGAELSEARPPRLPSPSSHPISP